MNSGSPEKGAEIRLRVCDPASGKMRKK